MEWKKEHILTTIQSFLSIYYRGINPSTAPKDSDEFKAWHESLPQCAPDGSDLKEGWREVQLASLPQCAPDGSERKEGFLATLPQRAPDGSDLKEGWREVTLPQLVEGGAKGNYIRFVNEQKAKLEAFRNDPINNPIWEIKCKGGCEGVKIISKTKAPIHKRSANCECYISENNKSGCKRIIEKWFECTEITDDGYQLNLKNYISRKITKA